MVALISIAPALMALRSGDLAAYHGVEHKAIAAYEAAPLIHSADERIDVRDLGFAARFFRDVTQELLG